MAISLKGVNLGYMGIGKTLLVEKPENENVQYQCPAIAYIIEHPDGRILWETGVSTRATEEWLSGLTEHWKVIFGPLLVLVAVFARGGLLGVAARLRRIGRD